MWNKKSFKKGWIYIQASLHYYLHFSIVVICIYYKYIYSIKNLSFNNSQVIAPQMYQNEL